MQHTGARPQPPSSGRLLSPSWRLLFLLEILAPVAFLWDQGPAKYFRPGQGAFFFSVLVGLFAAAAAGLAGLKILSRYSSYLAVKTQESRQRVATAVVLSLTPLLFFYLIFVQRAVYLREIGPALAASSLAGCFFLHGLFLWRIRRQFPGKIFQIRPTTAPSLRPFASKKLPWIVLFLLFALYALLASGAFFPPQPLTGDEPHYLILTKSFLSDRDLNLSNNYQNKDYLQFYPGELRPHTRAGKKGAEFQYSMHGPGLPLLLLPFYWVGEKAAATKASASGPEAGRNLFVLVVRLPLCFLAAFLGFLLFRLARDLTGDGLLPAACRGEQVVGGSKGVCPLGRSAGFMPRARKGGRERSDRWKGEKRSGFPLQGDDRASWAAWLIFGLTPPLLFYSPLLYPEIPAAVILLWVFSSMIINRNPGAVRCLVAGLGAAFLPWLGVKYSVLAAGLALAVALSLAGAKRGRLRNLILFLAPLLVSAGLYVYYLWSLYGYISPLSSYEGIEYKNRLAQRIFHFVPFDFLRSSLSYLFDQRIGILVYAPIYLLFFPGIFLALKKARRPAMILLAIFFLYWASCSLSNLRGGFCPPGRVLLPLLWIMALFLAFSLAAISASPAGPPHEEKPSGFFGARRAALLSLLAISLLTGFFTLSRPQLLYHEGLADNLEPRGMDSNLLTTLGNAFVDFRGFVPSLSGPRLRGAGALTAWILAAVLLTLLFLLKRKTFGKPVTYRRAAWPLAAVHVLAAIFVSYVFFNIRLNSPANLGPENIKVFFQDGHHFSPELDGFWTAGRFSAGLLVPSPKKVKRISVTVSSPLAGKTAVQVGRQQETIIRNKARGLEQTLAFREPVGFPWKGGRLYFVRIQESSLYIPFQLDSRVEDNRPLGVFVKIHAE